MQRFYSKWALLLFLLFIKCSERDVKLTSYTAMLLWHRDGRKFLPDIIDNTRGDDARISSHLSAIFSVKLLYCPDATIESAKNTRTIRLCHITSKAINCERVSITIQFLCSFRAATFVQEFFYQCVPLIRPHGR